MCSRGTISCNANAEICAPAYMFPSNVTRTAARTMPKNVIYKGIRTHTVSSRFESAAYKSHTMCAPVLRRSESSTTRYASHNAFQATDLNAELSLRKETDNSHTSAAILPGHRSVVYSAQNDDVKRAKSRMLRITLMINYKTEYNASLRIVGNGPLLGSWSPDTGIS